jgi:hypothetical protein
MEETGFGIQKLAMTEAMSYVTSEVLERNFRGFIIAPMGVLLVLWL